jgi:hypothetical protein
MRFVSSSRLGDGRVPRRHAAAVPHAGAGIPYREDDERALEALDEDLAWTGDGAGGDRFAWLMKGRRQRSSDAALSASRSLSPMTVAPELTGRGAVGPQVASRSNSRKKS